METRKTKIGGATWNQAAVLAYAGYTIKGPGAIVLDVLPLISPAPGAPPPTGQYLSLAELRSQAWMSAEALAAFPSYNAELELVVIGRALNGDLAISTMSDDGGDTPRKLYDQAFKLAREKQDAEGGPSAPAGAPAGQLWPQS